VTNQSPQGVDKFEPARAIRRALAAQNLKARDVELIVVWATGALSRERAEFAVTMGLGRFADGVSAVFDDPDPLARCAAALAGGQARVAVALVIDSDGNRAQAFGPKK
jgi:hypothetical protein